MEKYRKWTDPATGINPFITAKINKTNFLVTLIVGIVKSLALIVSIPFLLLLLILPLNFLNTFSIRILLFFLGMYSIDDDGFTRQLSSSRYTGKLILSNHVSFMDSLYYLYKLPNCRFVCISQVKGKYLKFTLVGPLKMILRALTRKQDCFEISSVNNATNFLDSLIDKHKGGLKSGHRIVLFYEQIRTNGLGTIKIDRYLVEQIHTCEKSAYLVHLKQNCPYESITSLTNSPLAALFSALSTSVHGSSLKVRSMFSGTNHKIQTQQTSILQPNSDKLYMTSSRAIQANWYSLLYLAIN